MLRIPFVLRLLTFIGSVLAVCPVAGLAQAPVAPSFRIVGYVTPQADMAQIPADKVTDLIFAFAEVTSGSEVRASADGVAEKIAELRSLKAKNPSLKILISVGGWGADHFSDAALTEASRKVFADSAAALVARYQLDGLDVDWEYPGQAGPGIKFRPEDKQNFTLLLKAIREKFDSVSKAGRPPGDPLLLTIASCDREYFDHTEMSVLHRYLDWLNVMTYDFYGSLTPLTGHHTGLYRTAGADPSSRYAQAAIEQHLAAGIPPAKLVLGVSFYGKSWVGVNPANHGILQPYARFGDWIPYEQLVRDYIGKPGFEQGWDKDAMAPYLWNSQTRTFVSYDDPRSIHQKALYVKEMHLGGIMYWEQSQDPHAVLLSAIHSELTAER